jgi:uncharacterized phage protein (TIGR01671 family)
MRQIKFRAWDKENKNMLYPKPLSPIKFMLSFSGEFGWFDLDKQMWSGIIPKRYYELMQYTGLKDKNGTEIYEGDILLVTSETYTNFGKTPTGRFSKEYYEVIWKDDGWGYKVLKSDHTIEGTEIKGLKVTTKYAEVIGNIYEHPHLLEGAK